MILIVAFLVLVVAGVYTGEMTKKSALIYLVLAIGSIVSVNHFSWDPAVLWLSIGFLDAILVIHVFKGDIVLRRW